jgi:hypothetical protein
MYPEFFTKEEYQIRSVCNDKHSGTWVDGDYDVTYSSRNDDPTAYDTPGLNGQLDYRNGNPNPNPNPKA